jgi:hypothetical protein
VPIKKVSGIGEKVSQFQEHHQTGRRGAENPKVEGMFNALSRASQVHSSGNSSDTTPIPGLPEIRYYFPRMPITDHAYGVLVQRLRTRLSNDRHNNKPITMKKRYGGEAAPSPVPLNAIAEVGGGVNGAAPSAGIS